MAYTIPPDKITGDTIFAEDFNNTKNSIDALKGGVAGDAPTRTVEEINTRTDTYSVHGNLSELTDDDHPQYMPTAATRSFSEIVSYNDNKVFTDDKNLIAKKYVDDKFYYKGNILGTVSQSGGIPTGAIIESGSNANGEYVKFADGTMICKHSADAAGYDLAGSNYYTWTFPAIFIGSLNAFSFIQRPANDSVTMFSRGGATNGTTQANFSHSASSVAGGVFMLFAIGKWF